MNQYLVLLKTPFCCVLVAHFVHEKKNYRNTLYCVVVAYLVFFISGAPIFRKITFHEKTKPRCVQSILIEQHSNSFFVQIFAQKRSKTVVKNKEGGEMTFLKISIFFFFFLTLYTPRATLMAFEMTPCC